jgi:hypothetical protein
VSPSFTPLWFTEWFTDKNCFMHHRPFFFMVYDKNYFMASPSFLLLYAYRNNLLSFNLSDKRDFDLCKIAHFEE